MDQEGLGGDRFSDCSHLLSGEEVTIIITVFGYPCEWVHIFLRTTNAYRTHLPGETFLGLSSVPGWKEKSWQ